jgi:hypothetical protein
VGPGFSPGHDTPTQLEMGLFSRMTFLSVCLYKTCCPFSIYSTYRKFLEAREDLMQKRCFCSSLSIVQFLSKCFQFGVEIARGSGKTSDFFRDFCLHFLKYFWPVLKVFGKPRGPYANKVTLAFFSVERLGLGKHFIKNKPALVLFKLFFLFF